MPYLSNIEICRIARRLAKKYRTANPEKLCRVLDIQIIYQDMGTEVTSIKALMVVDRRIKCIVVNANLPDVILNFILAHELGHAVLHANRCKQFTDYGLFSDTSIMEKEANIFAAELLIGDLRQSIMFLMNCLPISWRSWKMRAMTFPNCHTSRTAVF